MLFFLSKGFRVIASDRRGHGRSTQTGGGHDMDHYADDLKAVTDHLNLKDAIHIGHSTGGGQVVHYLARHGDKNVAKAAIISAVPPLMVKTPANPLAPAQIGVRRSPSPTLCQPGQVLLRPAGWPVLWLQPFRRENDRAYRLELVAPGYDGRCQGAL
jgi:pimeloyl-ACP methyl ester carboxylesterase